MKERIQMYEPFFHYYYIDEVLNNYELETLIRVKKDDIKLIDKETKEDLSNYIYAR